MKKLSNEKIIFIKRLIGLSCAVLCLLFMLINFISYTSSSTLKNGSAITWDDGLSLFSFLFNGNYEVLDSKASILRSIFTFSYVLSWISFVLCVISIGVLSVGVIKKNNLITKIGSYILLVATLILVLTIFDRYESGNTVKYLNIFTWGYGLIVLVSSLGLVATITLEDKKENK